MWYYVGADNQQAGPFTEAQWKDLVAAGTITDATLVWKEGLPDWKPLGSVALVSPPVPVAGAAAPAATCQVCGKAVGADNLIELAGLRTCAECKPKALQALTEGGHLTLSGIWRSGKKVIAPDGARFPARCVKCNQPGAEPPLKRKLFWHPMGYYLLIFLHVIIYVIVAMIVRRRGSAEIYLCQRHLNLRRNYLIGVWASLSLAVAAVIASVALSKALLAALGAVLLLVALTLGVFFVRPLATARIKDKVIWFNGAGKEFLASLPVRDE